jgi:hypothetical protein
MKAKGFVASIREIVDQKDAFTRMNQAREEERRARLAGAEQEKRAKLERAKKIEAAKQELYALFAAALTLQQRGKKLEAALNNLFAVYGISVSEAFHLVGDSGEGVVEQVDGVIELKGAFYFVEMKWYKIRSESRKSHSISSVSWGAVKHAAVHLRERLHRPRPCTRRATFCSTS